METFIAKLLQDFEQGKMNRRQLIKSLAVAATAAAAAAPAAKAAGKPLEALYVNHISYQVNDYKKVRDFYVDLLGMKATEDDGKGCRLVFGNLWVLLSGCGSVYTECNCRALLPRPVDRLAAGPDNLRSV